MQSMFERSILAGMGLLSMTEAIPLYSIASLILALDALVRTCAELQMVQQKVFTTQISYGGKRWF